MIVRFISRWIFGSLLFAVTPAFAAATRADLLRATETAIAGGNFTNHLDFLDNLILTNFKPVQNVSGTTAWDKTLGDEVAALAIAQAAVLHQVTPDNLVALTKTNAVLPGFLRWLFSDREALEAYLNTK